MRQEDIKAIRAKAASVGMSHQTLIADIMHQYVMGTLVDSSPAADFSIPPTLKCFVV